MYREPLSPGIPDKLNTSVYAAEQGLPRFALNK